MMPRPEGAAATFLIVVVVVAGFVVVAGGFSLGGQGGVSAEVPTSFTVNGKTFVFNFTATTGPERAAGLMNRRVTSTTTMLFVFPSFSRWAFWMYDTNTSLDMMWVNATGTSGRVVYLVDSALPCYNANACAIYTPPLAANYVIEAKAGFAANNGVTVGTEIQFG